MSSTLYTPILLLGIFYMQLPSLAQEELSSPCKNAYSVTPHATNEIGTVLPRYLYVGGAGNIACRLFGDIADISLVAVPVGTVLPIMPTHVRVTGTTATNLVAFY